MDIVTQHLALRDATAADLDAILRVRLSNPARLARTEGSAGEPGRYDRGMLERDVAIVGWDPNRRLSVVRRREDGAVVGIVDCLLRHPDDGLPWIGVIELEARWQRHGLGRETALAVVAYLAGFGDVVRAAVDEGDATARSFAESCGFREVERRGARVVLERRAVGVPSERPPGPEGRSHTLPG